MRVGIGFDAHRFAKGRKLIIGGVQIAHMEGLLGHSDADVLLHAICDAMLGALALGDIGRHFPDTDKRFKDIASTELLRRVKEMVEGHGHALVNVDATIIAQAPQMAPHIEEMRNVIARVLGCRVNDVGIKATTTEQMGFCGRGEGIAAMAVACLQKRGQAAF
jgi:2-C-methyl-D-erythritol 2,4-cyclodiphosphate synthase